MSSIFPLRAVWIMAALFLLANAVTVVNCIPNRELNSMLNTLRSRGYHLFCNAILTSDIRFDLLSFDDGNSNVTHSFTFFAPTDSSLFALDMTQSASSYTDTLRYHIIPRRLSLGELRLLPNGYTLPTLLHTRHLRVTRHFASSDTFIGGVEVSFPGIFYGRHIVVHGLSGILNLRSHNNHTSPAQIHSPDRRHFSSRTTPHSSENQTVLDPVSVPNSVSFNFTDRHQSSHPVDTPVPEPAQAPEIGIVHVHSAVNFSNAPSVAPVLPLQDLTSAISAPPEGYSDAEAPAPVDLEPVVQKNSRVSLLEMEGGIGMSVKSEALDEVGKCKTEAVGLKNDIDSVGHMQCCAT
ncbi:unnamed protein product [Lathyrus oleraceus]|uniref:uncharacterized protein LOC127085234 n=1 Tax=Pisum sativum TaxID=3888 RepID=UPI0021D1113E|nr:uncharacterized protein LOC127085234 [Pisum sativum]